MTLSHQTRFIFRLPGVVGNRDQSLQSGLLCRPIGMHLGSRALAQAGAGSGWGGNEENGLGRQTIGATVEEDLNVVTMKTCLISAILLFAVLSGSAAERK